MNSDTSEDHRLLQWLQAYTYYICDRLNFPKIQGEELLENFLKLPARDSAQQSSVSPYEQPASHIGTTFSHCETRHAQHLTNPDLATNTQDQAIIPRESCDRHNDACTGYNTDHLSSSMATETTSSVPQLQSYPENQRSGGMMPMDLGQSEGSHQLSQPIQAVEDRASIGSITEYDPLWVQKDKVNPEIVEGFSSKLNFDTLFSSSVIRPGDVLAIQVTIFNNGNDTETEAHVTVRPRPPSNEH